MASSKLRLPPGRKAVLCTSFNSRGVGFLFLCQEFRWLRWAIFCVWTVVCLIPGADRTLRLHNRTVFSAGCVEPFRRNVNRVWFQSVLWKFWIKTVSWDKCDFPTANWSRFLFRMTLRQLSRLFGNGDKKNVVFIGPKMGWSHGWNRKMHKKSQRQLQPNQVST